MHHLLFPRKLGHYSRDVPSLTNSVCTLYFNFITSSLLENVIPTVPKPELAALFA